MTDPTHDRRLRLAFEIEAACALLDKAAGNGLVAGALLKFAESGIAKPGENGGISAYGIDAGHSGMGHDVLAYEWRTAAMLRVATLRAEVSIEPQEVPA